MNYPPLRLEHLFRLSDSTGVLQHARWTVPDLHSGYTVDDNAYALVVALKHHALTGETTSLELARRCLALITFMQTSDGRFLSLLPYNHNFVPDFGSPETSGRGLWALGYCLRLAPEEGMRRVAAHVFERALPNPNTIMPPRATALNVLGLVEGYRAGWARERLMGYLERYADRLAGLFDHYSTDDWVWFESRVSFLNAVMPEAMLWIGQLLNNGRYHSIGERTLDFLIHLLFQDDKLDLIGHQESIAPDSPLEYYDQYAIDAVHIVQALYTAQQILGSTRYSKLARAALEWFYGRNRANLSLYDPATGGCQTSLTREGVNPNQGAQPTLACLLARLLWEESEREAQAIPR